MRLTAIVAAVALAVGLAGGWGVTASRYETRIARMERDEALQLAAMADAASERLLKTQQRSDALTTDLSAALRAAQQLQRGLDDAIARTTDGRVCLREPALRVLDGAPGLRVDGLPPSGGGAAGADAGRVATDVDVGRWAAAAGQQYNECRRRLDALIDWHATEGNAHERQ